VNATDPDGLETGNDGVVVDHSRSENIGQPPETDEQRWDREYHEALRARASEAGALMTLNVPDAASICSQFPATRLLSPDGRTCTVFYGDKELFPKPPLLIQFWSTVKKWIGGGKYEVHLESDARNAACGVRG
jgi:hypothetical protein